MKRLLLLAGGMLLLSSLAFAWLRGSASFQTDPDGVTRGGGRSTSTTYIAAQQAIGGPVGYGASPSHQNLAGVVQPIPSPAPPSEVPGWKKI